MEVQIFDSSSLLPSLDKHICEARDNLSYFLSQCFLLQVEAIL